MTSKALWTSVLIVGVLAVGGLGFAAFTASYQVNLQGTAGNLGLTFENSNQVVSSSVRGLQRIDPARLPERDSGPVRSGRLVRGLRERHQLGERPRDGHLVLVRHRRLL